MNKWCKTGVDLLALQPIDRFQSSEGAEKALDEIDNFLKSPQGMNMLKVKKMAPASNALGNKTLISKHLILIIRNKVDCIKAVCLHCL